MAFLLKIMKHDFFFFGTRWLLKMMKHDFFFGTRCGGGEGVARERVAREGVAREGVEKEGVAMVVVSRLKKGDEMG